MKVIIAGSRSFGSAWVSDRKLIDDMMEQFIDRITEVVCGGARGADKEGKQWAIRNGKTIKMFPADWGKHKNRAGMVRNAQMIHYADAAVVFWDGESRGTKALMGMMRRAGKTLMVVRF